MIELVGLTKRYGAKVAVDDLTVTIRPGVVTGFLGPNGAGKSTTMRLVLGLDRPTSGTARVNGREYVGLGAPLREVGALLEARSLHAGRTARNHLRVLAATHGIGPSRVDELLEFVGLTEVANKRVGAFSLGMGQRLGVAAALLGDPSVLLLDEPANGLDPEGMRWIRHLLSRLAAEGRTVFVSSHVMSEMQQIAEHLVVIGRGRLIADCPVDEFVARGTGFKVRVRSPRLAQLVALLVDAGAVVEEERDAAEVSGLTAEEIGELAAGEQIVLHELAPVGASLEEAFMQLTSDAVEYHGMDRP
ncbi:MAG TPA: ATP-binding cassette domain-containing protein [Mycobacteriales bacterium]|nr:ATP-binding cassette domain-containing protein [Mycobacteriales bacterium]